MGPKAHKRLGLKWVLRLMAHKISEKHLPLKQEPNCFYSSETVEILWDCTISTDGCPESEGNRPHLFITDRKKKTIK